MLTGVQMLSGFRACMSEYGTKSISADRFLRCSNVPLWKHLIDRPLTTDEHVSLVADLFSDRDEVEALKGLSGGDAQLFIDVVDKVSFRSRVRMAGLLTCARTLPSRWVAVG